jgi:aquaporin Z
MCSEPQGTFFLVLVAAGGPMIARATPGRSGSGGGGPGDDGHGHHPPHGKVSGAHLDPTVSIVFSLRGHFPWRWVPGYAVVHLVGAILAALFLPSVIHVSALYGSNVAIHLPGHLRPRFGPDLAIRESSPTLLELQAFGRGS